MNRRRSNSLAGSPLLIGAVTTLIVMVAVFISYNANNGLPFTPTYNIKVQLPEGSALIKNNQVRIGGTRVGVISSLAPYQDPKTGRVTAIASLKLEKSAGPLPVDTKAVVQSVSTIGLKYLSLERGHSQQMLKGGATIPVSHTREPVDIDQFFDMFDKNTRIANQVNLTTFGNGLAERGIGLNETLATLRPLLTNAIPVLRNLASPQTGFGELFVALDRAAKEVAPAAEAQAGFSSEADTFFTAWASVAPSLEEAIKEGPAALHQGTVSLPFEAEFVNKSAEFMHLLRPSASILRTVAAPLGHALSVGAVNVRAATALAPEVRESSQALAEFAKSPIVTSGVEQLTRTLGFANPLLAGVTPAQVNCNYLTLSFRNLASLLSESVGVGTLGRAAAILAPDGPNNEGAPSSAPANGPSVDHAPPETNPLTGEKVAGPPVDNNHLHYNPYPYVGGPGQPRVCEAGNETYTAGKTTIGNLPTSSPRHEVTERKNDRFGNEYPRATLEALGLAGSKGNKK
jgi:virulence factor Mce-like protein